MSNKIYFRILYEKYLEKMQIFESIDSSQYRGAETREQDIKNVVSNIANNKPVVPYIFTET